MVLEHGDWVWLHIRKERFPVQRRSKLLPRGDGPFQVLERVNDNAYKLYLPGEYNISTTFNVADLSPFDVGDTLDLRTNPPEEGGNDADQRSPMAVPVVPVTQSRAKKFKDKLSGLIQAMLDQELSKGLIKEEGSNNSRCINLITCKLAQD